MQRIYQSHLSQCNMKLLKIWTQTLSNLALRSEQDENCLEVYKVHQEENLKKSKPKLLTQKLTLEHDNAEQDKKSN
jgi:hypothetical protein